MSTRKEQKEQQRQERIESERAREELARKEQSQKALELYLQDKRESYTRGIIRLAIQEVANDHLIVLNPSDVDRMTRNIESRLAYEGLLKRKSETEESS